MSPICKYSVSGSTAVLTMENPPVNGLSLSLRKSIIDAIDRANEAPSVRNIVLVGSGRGFSAGADIQEFQNLEFHNEPTLATVIGIIEQNPKAVIAAVTGICMGGGLELALGCHYRIASRGAQLALPEVKLGIIPGAGGTQRLPRAVGIEQALKMIVSGSVCNAEEFQGSVFDEILEVNDFLNGIFAFAVKIDDLGPPFPRLRDHNINDLSAEAFFDVAKKAVTTASSRYIAPARCVEAVAGSVNQSFEAGLVKETNIFLELVNSAQSRALRHAFFGERAASKIPGVFPGTFLRPIREAGVVGAGTMGGGIAMNFANAGVPVVVVEVEKGRLDQGIETIRRNYESSVRKGSISAQQAEQRMGLIRPSLQFEALAGANIVVEAVFEEISAKREVFQKLDSILQAGAILATNTSTLNVDQIATFTRRPEDVVGTHFFSPANVMKLLEVVRGQKTAKDVLATIMQLAKTMQKVAVVAGVCDGFIGNRMIEPYTRQAMFLLEEGALPHQIDRVLEAFGMAMGPFRMSDLAGNDVSWYIRKRHYVERPDTVFSRLADRLCEVGRFGQKTGAGWYKYSPGDRTAHPDPEVEQIILSYSKEIEIERRQISDAEIIERCMYALVNEGAKVLADGIAARASDIDIVYLHGYGYPRFRGGPMQYAEEVGLYNVVRTMRRFANHAHGDRSFWEPAALLIDLVEQNRGFSSLDKRIGVPTDDLVHGDHA
jgi:3-hydroxyacyl-CoA dehydrogenase